MEDDSLQLFEMLLKRYLLVFPEEEFRVRKDGRATPFFVSFDDDFRVTHRCIVHGYEMRKELTLIVDNREILLMPDHGRNQDIPRKLEEFGVETPADRGWIFD